MRANRGYAGEQRLSGPMRRLHSIQWLCNTRPAGGSPISRRRPRRFRRRSRPPAPDRGPSLLRICPTWVLTVASDRNRCAAISGLDSPCAISVNTSHRGQGVFIEVERGQHHDLELGQPGSGGCPAGPFHQLPGGFDPIHAGHPDVHQHYIGGRGGQAASASLPLPDWMTTSRSGWLLISMVNPDRTSCWSSTSATRIGSVMETAGPAVGAECKARPPCRG